MHRINGSSTKTSQSGPSTKRPANLTSATLRDKFKQILCRARRGNGLIKSERKPRYRVPKERTIISRLPESVPSMESPSSSLTFSNVTEDTRTCCCAVVDIVNFEKSLKVV